MLPVQEAMEAFSGVTFHDDQSSSGNYLLHEPVPIPRVYVPMPGKDL